jgi:hypothetical protein
MTTTLDKSVRAGHGHLKAPEPTARGRAQDTGDASQVPSPSVGQSRWEKLPFAYKKVKGWGQVTVPVLSSLGKPLMPTRPCRAKELLKSGRAIKRWYRGVFCIKIVDRSDGKIQQVVSGIDTGSKREAFSVLSSKHTFLNILSDAVTHVSDRIKLRKDMRRKRRYKNSPCRTNKCNRLVNRKRLPASTRARWQIKLNILTFLKKLYPISDIVVEDIKAITIGKRKWDQSFTPLESGKNWFYTECRKIGCLSLRRGYETKKLRDNMGLKKSKRKLSETFNTHNVDSWVLANSVFENRIRIPENKKIYRIVPIKFHRRQLHLINPQKSDIRKPFGGTKSLNFIKGSVIKHFRFGLAFIGGTFRGRISLHDIKTGERISQYVSAKRCKFLYKTNWRSFFVT